MKKHPKKLALHRETVRRLEASGDLDRIAGGLDTSYACELATGCDCETAQGCYPPTACLGGCSYTGNTCRGC